MAIYLVGTPIRHAQTWEWVVSVPQPIRVSDYLVCQARVAQNVRRGLVAFMLDSIPVIPKQCQFPL